MRRVKYSQHNSTDYITCIMVKKSPNQNRLKFQPILSPISYLNQNPDGLPIRFLINVEVIAFLVID